MLALIAALHQNALARPTAPTATASPHTEPHGQPAGGFQEPGRQKRHRLQIVRSSPFFAAFLANIQIFAGEIVKNCLRWGQFSLRRILAASLLAAIADEIARVHDSSVDPVLPWAGMTDF